MYGVTLLWLKLKLEKPYNKIMAHTVPNEDLSPKA